MWLALGILILWGWLGAASVAAQVETALILTATELARQPDAFGGDSPVVRGELYNHGTEAYRHISISVEAYDSDFQLIGDGFGFLVDACGTALLDYALPPGRTQTYTAPYELFAEGEVAQVKLSVDGSAVAWEAPGQVEAPALQRISVDEVVMLEWLDEQTLIYGVGCDGDVFTELAWWRYSLVDHALSEIEHPDAQRVTAEMIARSDVALITQSGEQNPALFYRSQMTFPPGARRVVYQNDLHTIFSAEPDGGYKRLIHDKLHQHSLRGFTWAQKPGVFLAYYFGAYGEPVRYFIADVEGRMVSDRLEDLPESQIVPGLAPDGLAALVGRRNGDVSGYYWQYAFGGADLLLEAALPGNNYPAPIVTPALIYLVRPIDDVPTLQCYDRSTRTLETVSALPLRLTRESRAWAWLSPDGGKLALAASGVDGGAWWLDVEGGCA